MYFHKILKSREEQMAFCWLLFLVLMAYSFQFFFSRPKITPFLIKVKISSSNIQININVTQHSIIKKKHFEKTIKHSQLNYIPDLLH